jgi:hypothetical protein
MKSRTGFVSNSSSSSFLIALPYQKTTRTYTDIKKFFNKKLITNSTEDIFATYLLGCLNNRKVWSKKELVRFFDSCVNGYFGSIFDETNETWTNAQWIWINGEPDCNQELKNKYIKLDKEYYYDEKITDKEKKEKYLELNKISLKIAKQWLKNWLKKNNINWKEFDENTHDLFIFSHEDKGQFACIDQEDIFTVPFMRSSNH